MKTPSSICTVAIKKGRPIVLRSGRPVPQASYFERIFREGYEERVLSFVRAGVKVFRLRVPVAGRNRNFHDSAFWPDDGVHPSSEDPSLYPWPIARQAAFILSHQPKALFVIDVSTSVPLAWAKKYPHEMQRDEFGHVYRDVSLASKRYHRDFARFLRHVVGHCERQPWGDRIVGYQLISLLGEGLLHLAIAGRMFDVSPAAQHAFREWTKRRYGSVGSLRRAWGNPRLTFQGVRIPTEKAWHRKKASATPTFGGQPIPFEQLPVNGPTRHEGLFHWVEEANATPERDYARFMRDLFFLHTRNSVAAVKAACAAAGRRRIVGIDLAKQPLLGWQILSAFDGIGDGTSFPSMHLFSGSWDVGPLLDNSGMDYIWTPADYTARHMGFAHEAEGLADSLVLRGKTMIIENDARCHVGPARTNQGSFRNPREVAVGLLRNAAMTLTRGVQSYWCNVTGGKGFYDDPSIERAMAKVAPLLDRLNTAPHRETREAIAFIIDDESPLHENFTTGFQNLAVIWQRILGLSHCGVPYRIYLLSDLAKRNLPAYRTWFFPNLFKVDTRVLRLLRSKVLRDGNLAIFGPATGITDGRFLGAAGASKLLGVPMELLPRTTKRQVIIHDDGHAVTRELSANLTYGDSLAYGPTLLPVEGAVERAGAVALGRAVAYFWVDRDGLFLKEFGRGARGNRRPGPRGPNDYAVAWTSALPLPAELLRSLVRHGGGHVWCEENDVIYASENLAAIHTSKAGPRTLKLPRPCVVRDAMSGEILGRRLREIRLKLRSPDTRLFELTPSPRVISRERA